MVHKTIFSSKIVHWNTPKYFYDELNKEFNFQLDPCTTEDNPLGTSHFYTEKDNGLILPWINPTFVNPPYGRRKKVMDWLDKALQEQYINGVTSVFLLPSRTGTIWFHRYIYNKPDVEIRFIKGRLKFTSKLDDRIQTDQTNNTAPFDSMVVIFNGYT